MKKNKHFIATVRCGCGKRVTGVNTFYKVICKHCLAALYLEVTKLGVIPWRENPTKKKHCQPEIETCSDLGAKKMVLK